MASLNKPTPIATSQENKYSTSCQSGESRELIADATEHYCHQTRTTNSQKTLNPSRNKKDENVPQPLTEKALVQHNRQQYHLWADAQRKPQDLQQQSEGLRAAAQSLGVDLPEALIRNVTRKYDSFTPMERFEIE